MIDKNSLQQLVKANLEELERARLQQEEQFAIWRKQYEWRAGGLSLLLFLGGIGGLFAEEGKAGYMIVAVVLVIIVSIIAMAMYYNKTKPFRQKLRNRVKKEVYKKALAQWYPHFTYHPQQFLSESTYKEAALFGAHDIYKGDDFFEGSLSNGQKVTFSELEVQSESTDTAPASTLFKGLFFVVELSTTIEGAVKILPDVAERGMGKLGMFFQKKLGKLGHGNSQLVYFEEYPAFEKEFVVYSSEESLARQLISPQLVELIQEISTKTEGIALSFAGNQLYLAASSKKEFLEVDIKQDLTAPHLFQQLLEDLHYSLELIQGLEQLSLLEIATKGSRHPIQPLQKRAPIPQKSSLSYKKSNSKDNPFLL